MSGQSASRHYYPALTGIRAVAAWMVFIHHFNFFKPEIFGTPVFTFFSEFHIGVTIFFVLSGLLLTLRYYDRSLTGTNEWRNYFVKRLARIAPPFILILVINFIWLIATGKYNGSFDGGGKQFLGAATLVRGFFSGFAPELVPQSWSLTTEECFYMACPFIFFLLKKNLRLIIWLPLFLLCCGMAMATWFAAHPFHGFFSDVRFMFNFTFFGRCIEFFAGICLALVCIRLSPQHKPGIVFTITGTVIIILSVIALASLHDGNHFGDYHPLGIVINNAVLPIAGIAVLFWGLLTERNWLTRLLASAPMVLLGKSSYIFYLIHIGFFLAVFYNSVSRNPLLVFLYLNAVSIALYLVFEHPVNGWLLKKFLVKASAPETEDKEVASRK